MYKGTNKKAFDIAGREKTQKKRSLRYYREKERIEGKPSVLKMLLDTIFDSHKYNFKKYKVANIQNCTKTKGIKPQKTKFAEKQLVLDDIRKAMSSKTVSYISNELAKAIAKYFDRELTNREMNEVRSVIALTTSIVIETEFKEMKDAIDKIKLFVNICGKIYRIICWLDKHENTYKTEENVISEVLENNIEYVQFLKKYKISSEIVETNKSSKEMTSDIADTQLYTLFELWDIYKRPFLATDDKWKVKIYKSPYSYNGKVYGYLCGAENSNYINEEIWYSAVKKWKFITILK